MRIKGVKRFRVFEMFNRRCAYCGRKIKFECFEVDHIVSSVEFQAKQFAQAEVFSPVDGSIIERFNDKNNLFPSCIPCNRIKKHYSLEDFRNSLLFFAEDLLEQKAKCKILYRLGFIQFSEKPLKFYFEKAP